MSEHRWQWTSRVLLALAVGSAVAWAWLYTRRHSAATPSGTSPPRHAYSSPQGEPMVPKEAPHRTEVADLPSGAALLIVDEDTNAPIMNARVSGGLNGPDAGYSLSDSSGKAKVPVLHEHASPNLRRGATEYLVVTALGYSPRIVLRGQVQAAGVGLLQVDMSPSSALEVCVVGVDGLPAKQVLVSVTVPRSKIADPEAQEVLDAKPLRYFGSMTDALGESNLGGLSGVQEWIMRTGEDGCARIDDLPARVRLAVRLGRAGRVLKRIDTPVVLEPRRLERVHYRIPTEADFRGVLIGPNDEPIPGCPVWVVKVPWSGQSVPSAASRALFSMGARPQREAHTNESGEFIVPRLVAGAWYIGPSPLSPQDQSGRPREPQLAPLGTAFLWDGQSDQVHVVRCESPVWIGGYVIGPTGPVASAAVYAEALTVWGALAAKCDGDGLFRIGPLVVGEYSLVAVGPHGGSGTPIKVVAPSDLAVLDIGGSGTVCLVPGTASMESAAVHSILATRVGSEQGLDWVTMAGGPLPHTLSPLPEGQWSLSVTASGNQIAVLSKVEVVSGQRTEVRLLGEPSCQLHVSLVDGVAIPLAVVATLNGVAVSYSQLETGQTDFDLRVPCAAHIVLEFRVGDTLHREESVRIGSGREQQVSL